MHRKWKVKDSKAEVLKKIFQQMQLGPGDPHWSLLLFWARKCLSLTSPSVTLEHKLGAKWSFKVFC